MSHSWIACNNGRGGICYVEKPPTNSNQLFHFREAFELYRSRSYRRAKYRNPIMYGKIFNKKENAITDKSWARKSNITAQELTIQRKFLNYATRWRKETGGYSTLKNIFNNENYISIIALSPKSFVISLILEELRQEPDYWLML